MVQGERHRATNSRQLFIGSDCAKKKLVHRACALENSTTLFYGSLSEPVCAALCHTQFFIADFHNFQQTCREYAFASRTLLPRATMLPRGPSTSIAFLPITLLKLHT